MNIYVELTREFNQGELRAVLSSGQAVVLHKLAVMSKDGDWILEESVEALEHILGVLGNHSAGYRFGAPLDVRWMKGGWSSHFEFREKLLRVRTDFVTRPPRLSPADLRVMWQEQGQCDVPVVSVRHLVELKKTNREKDYAVIGELARLLKSPEDELMSSRSARDLIQCGLEHPDYVNMLVTKRPVLKVIQEGELNLEKALDAERRELMHKNEERLSRYIKSAEDWAAIWPDVACAVADLPLKEAHKVVVSRAEGVLPFEPAG
ncbi:MAG: hypothetical protein WCN95_16565 [bacterium]